MMDFMRRSSLVGIVIVLIVFFYSIRLSFIFANGASLDVAGLLSLMLSSTFIFSLLMLKPFVLKDKILWITILYLLVLFVQFLRSPNYPSASIYFLLQLFSLGVFILLRNNINLSHIKSINMVLYMGGVVFYFPLFLMFLYIVVFEGSIILEDPRLWEVGGGIYEVQFGNNIAFQGLVGDPNLVGPAAAIFFYLGLMPTLKYLGMFRFFGNSVLLSVIFLSGSRGALASLAIGWILVKGLESRSFIIDSVKNISKLVFVATLLFGVSLLVTGMGNPVQKIARGAGRRFAEWSEIFDKFMQNPIFGNGLGFNKLVLGKQAENGFLNLLSETGLIGFSVFILIVVLVLKQYREIRNNKDALVFVRPWAMYSVFMFFACMYTSSEGSANLWVSLGIVAGSSYVIRKNLANVGRVGFVT